MSITRRASRPCTARPTRATTRCCRLQGEDRLPGAGQYQLQRARRADRLFPEDAFRCFMGSEIEVLVAGDCLLHKEQQSPALKLDYRDVFDPD
jgi:hypothetical protein